MNQQYDGIEGLQPRLPLGAALTIGVKGPSGAPTQTDRFHFVSPHDSMDGKFRVRPLLPQFSAFNGADASKRQMIRANLIHSTRAEAFAYHLRAQQLGGKWPNHPQKRPACTGDGQKATRFFGDTPEDFREIDCPNELCEFRQGNVKACKPFGQLLFRPRWADGSPLPTPLTKLTTGSWYSVAALLGFFDHVEDQARQLGIESYSLYGLPFSIQLTFKSKPQAQQRFPVLAFSPEVDLVQFFLAQREQLDRIGGHAPLALPAVALTDDEMRSPDVLASDAALISGPVQKPANAPEIIEAEEVQANPATMSPEAVARILAIAKGKGIDAGKLDAMIGGKLADAPPSAELEILRQIAVSK